MADLREFELAEKRGEYVKKADAEAEWVRIVCEIRSALLSIPARCAPQWAAITDPRTLYIEIEREINSVLTQLADEI